MNGNTSCTVAGAADDVVTATPPSPGTTAVAVPPTVAPVGKAKVAISYLSETSDANLIVAIQSIVTGMTGNAAYPAPNPPLANITAARDSFIAAVNAAKDSRRQIVVRNQQRATVVALLRTLAHYVQVASGGDLPTLLGSGFIAQRGRQPVGPLPAPANLRLARGSNSGQIIARCQKLKQARAYEWRYATAAAPTAWVEVDATFAASFTITGLVPGTRYSVQVRALGTAGPSDWSDAAMLMVV
jgi:hypothetical protein